MAPGRDLPSWIESERWDIIAKAPDVSDPSTIRAMLQRLLVDRFKMSFRWETRDLPVYAIVQDKPGRLGPALVRSTADCGTASCGMRSSRSPETGGTISGVSVTIPDLILRLAARDGDTPLSER
jgi:uncharacterized protein (TIGR03435 family)